MKASAQLVLILVATGVVAAVPPAAASDCASGLVVHGRSALAPGLVPPPLPIGRVCVPLQSSIGAGRTLPPGADQIFVRLEADLGPSYPLLGLKLDGLGWRGQLFSMSRVTSATGASVYDLSGWLTIPDVEAGDKLRATVFLPGGHGASVEYSPIVLPRSVTTV